MIVSALFHDRRLTDDPIEIGMNFPLENIPPLAEDIIAPGEAASDLRNSPHALRNFAILMIQGLLCARSRTSSRLKSRIEAGTPFAIH